MDRPILGPSFEESFRPGANPNPLGAGLQLVDTFDFRPDPPDL